MGFPNCCPLSAIDLLSCNPPTDCLSFIEMGHFSNNISAVAVGLWSSGANLLNFKCSDCYDLCTYSVVPVLLYIFTYVSNFWNWEQYKICKVMFIITQPFRPYAQHILIQSSFMARCSQWENCVMGIIALYKGFKPFLKMRYANLHCANSRYARNPCNLI